MSITEQLRRLLLDSGESRYAIAMATGLDQAGLKRFAEGSGLRSDAMDKLAEYFGVEIKPRRVAKRTRR